MLAIHHPAQVRHDPGRVFFNGRFVPHWDSPERQRIFLDVLASGGHAVVEAPDSDLAPVLAVHDADYVDFLRTAWERWSALPGAGEQAIPNVHPTFRMRRKPDSFVAQLGWYANSTSCPIDAETFGCALASASVAVHGADRLAAGGHRTVYALCRPPGHHAYRDLMSGICYLNNAAIAAERLAGRLGRIAVLDVDVHHGNGTQSIFYARGDVLYVSVHVDPAVGPPYYAGYAEETGEGAGLGCTLNLPLPWGTTDAPFLAGLDRGLAAVAAFAPAAIVVSLGLDASENERVPTFRVSDAAFAAMARRIAGLQRPLLLVQEGGYLHPHLGRCLAAVLDGFDGRP